MSPLKSENDLRKSIILSQNLMASSVYSPEQSIYASQAAQPLMYQYPTVQYSNAQYQAAQYQTAQQQQIQQQQMQQYLLQQQQQQQQVNYQQSMLQASPLYQSYAVQPVVQAQPGSYLQYYTPQQMVGWYWYYIPSWIE